MSALLAAAGAPNPAAAARRYAALGFSAIPLRGKVPCITWETCQQRRPTAAEIERWTQRGLFENVGLVCGEVSGGLVVLDLDGEAAYRAFAERFPALARTYTVRTGSGVGYHVYLTANSLPKPTRALHTPLGNLELRAEGQQVAAPPSVHPQTRQPYRVHLPLPIQHAASLDPVAAWIRSFQPKRCGSQAGRPSAKRANSAAQVNPRLVTALTNRLQALGYRAKGEWLNGPCVYPQRHAHADHRSSFGFNTRTGYGNCFVCGSLRARDIALALSIDPADYGGVVV